MAHFLLIHGSCHGAWCWHEVIPLLEAAGHKVRAIDLPAHGADDTPASDATLSLYADAILNAAEDRVHLVGHSAAGFPITLAAERAPDRIARLIYLCAYVPKPGMSMIDMRRAGPRQTLTGVVHADPGGITYRVDADGARRCFYHDCDDSAVDFALQRLCPEPIMPQSTVLPPLQRWSSVEKHYLLCEDDHTIPPEYQHRMSAEFPAETVHPLPCGHSPFFAVPRLLAAHLDAIAAGGAYRPA
ncbi:MAG: alpha/beta fold hydrolase [Rhodobacteraceae bacterium]|nr:alpha/beta fold hydrolase [Paracoccaceae bacterium]